MRLIFGNLSIAWQTLTDTQRDSWATYAANVPVRNRLGDTIFLTGHTMYIRNNAARLQAGLPRVDDGPTVFAAALLSPVSLAPIGIFNNLNIIVNTADPWTLQAGGALLVYATRQNTRTVRFRKNPYRLITAILAPLVIPPARLFTPTFPFALDSTTFNAIFTRFVAVTADGRISAHEDRGPTTITDI